MMIIMVMTTIIRALGGPTTGVTVLLTTHSLHSFYR